MRSPRALPLLLVAGLVVSAGVALAVDRLAFSGSTQLSRPALQRVLDGLVSGPAKIAPGATAFVAGPHGRWLGAAGIADTSTGAKLPADARMRTSRDPRS